MWNYQVIKKQLDDESWEYRICEVYRIEGEPGLSYTWPDDTIIYYLAPGQYKDEDDVLEDLRWALTHMLKDLDRPVLRVDDRGKLHEDIS